MIVTAEEAFAVEHAQLPRRRVSCAHEARRVALWWAGSCATWWQCHSIHRKDGWNHRVAQKQQYRERRELESHFRRRRREKSVRRWCRFHCFSLPWMSSLDWVCKKNSSLANRLSHRQQTTCCLLPTAHRPNSIAKPSKHDWLSVIVFESSVELQVYANERKRVCGSQLKSLFSLNQLRIQSCQAGKC